MKKDEMKEKVLEYIEQNDHVSYAELEWLFEQNDYDYKGELDALSERCEHVVFWTGWQQEAYDMLGERRESAAGADNVSHLSDRWKNIVTSTSEAKHAVQNRPLAAGSILQGAGAAVGCI